MLLRRSQSKALEFVQRAQRAYTNLPEGQEWLESPRQKILSGKAVKNSKEPVWPGNFSPTEPDKMLLFSKCFCFYWYMNLLLKGFFIGKLYSIKIRGVTKCSKSSIISTLSIECILLIFLLNLCYNFYFMRLYCLILLLLFTLY